MSTYITKVLKNPRNADYVLLIPTDGTKVPSVSITKTRAKSLGMSVNKCYLIDTWSKAPAAGGKAYTLIRVHSCLSTAAKPSAKKKNTKAK
jgi:hypothetical protein